MDQLIINPSIRLIPHRQVNPGFFVYDALVMGKGFEAFLTVIASHTAFPKAAEWHFAGGEVNDHIVDTATAEATLRGDFFADGFFLGMEFTFRITSSMESKVRTGITGPKISSCITASSKVT